MHYMDRQALISKLSVAVIYMRVTHAAFVSFQDVPWSLLRAYGVTTRLYVVQASDDRSDGTVKP